MKTKKKIYRHLILVTAFVIGNGIISTFLFKEGFKIGAIGGALLYSLALVLHCLMKLIDWAYKEDYPHGYIPGEEGTHKIMENSKHEKKKLFLLSVKFPYLCEIVWTAVK